MMSLGGAIIPYVALLYGLEKAGRGLIYEQPFRVILSLTQKSITKRIRNKQKASFFSLNIGFINFDLFFLHIFYILLWIYITNRNKLQNKILKFLRINEGKTCGGISFRHSYRWVDWSGRFFLKGMLLKTVFWQFSKTFIAAIFPTLSQKRVKNFFKKRLVNQMTSLQTFLWKTSNYFRILKGNSLHLMMSEILDCSSDTEKGTISQR